MKTIMPEQSREYRYICVDFDGTLCEECWPEIGEPKWYVFGWLNAQRIRFESKIILHTCRAGESLLEAIVWCRDKGLVFDSINSNPFSEFAHLGEGNKPYADIYLDDKAYRC